jgi:RNA-directed DNA polymerase
LEDTEVQKYFLNLTSRRDIANLFGVSYKKLNYLLYILNPDEQYETFFIPKKKSGQREIVSPTSEIKAVQRKLNEILQAVYNVKPSAHGFLIERNIVTNATPHANKRFVFNLDLKDYFPSIHFGRVRGLFKGKPYLLPEDVATYLAQICCYKGKLPQGAPTSPIVSNMICAQLDSHLQNLASKYYCTYTRYADDITFSCNLKQFPHGIAVVEMIREEKKVRVGGELERIIEENGFKINRDKVRLQVRSVRQEVTGLTVNKFPNVSRRYVRQIRAMLHAWEKYGHELAEQEYLEKYRSKKGYAHFYKVVKGKIDFLKMVRGEEDLLYMKFMNKFHSLRGLPEPFIVEPYRRIESALWVLECDRCESQGTAFFLKNYGLVTCDHVLTDSLKVFHTESHNKKYDVKVIARHEALDVKVKLFPNSIAL